LFTGLFQPDYSGANFIKMFEVCQSFNSRFTLQLQNKNRKRRPGVDSRARFMIKSKVVNGSINSYIFFKSLIVKVIYIPNFKYNIPERR